MKQKIKQWFANRRQKHNTPPLETELYTREQVEKIANEYGQVRYNDGKRDGLAIARQQATNSLKEILRQQNRQP